MQSRVVEVWDETSDARTITLKPGANWRGHRPGQHIRVGVAIDGQHYTRTYSISSSPERADGLFTITVKAIQGGRLSHYIVRKLKVGDYVPVGLPQGDFYLPDASPTQPLFITAGSGITPVMSMLRSMIDQQRMANSVHIHYAPGPQETIFGSELRDIDRTQTHYQLHEVHTATMAADDPARHFSLDNLERLCPDWRERDCYACGPQDMLRSVETLWHDAGLSHRLHIERFRADFAKLPDDAVGGRVRFANSNVEVNADGATNLLRIAEDAGLNPPHGCRMGICHTCNTTLKSGCVRDLRTGEILNEAGAIVQTCICAAAGDCELEL